jgi:hypothetical protein
MPHRSCTRTPAPSRSRQICVSRLAASILAALLAMSVGASLLRFDLSRLEVTPVIAERSYAATGGHLAFDATGETASPLVSPVHSA